MDRIDKEKLDRFIQAAADLSGLTPKATLVAIRGEDKSSIALMGNPDDVVTTLKEGMERDPGLRTIFARALGADPNRKEKQISSSFDLDDFKGFNDILRKEAGIGAAIFSVALGSEGIAVQLNGSLGKLIGALKAAMMEKPEIRQLLELALKCDLNCANCKMKHEEDADYTILN